MKRVVFIIVLLAFWPGYSYVSYRLIAPDVAMPLRLADSPAFFEKNFNEDAKTKLDTLVGIEEEIKKTRSEVERAISVPLVQPKFLWGPGSQFSREVFNKLSAERKKAISNLLSKLENLEKNKKNIEALYRIHILQARGDLLHTEYKFMNDFEESTTAKNGAYTREDLELDKTWLNALNSELNNLTDENGHFNSERAEYVSQWRKAVFNDYIKVIDEKIKNEKNDARKQMLTERKDLFARLSQNLLNEVEIKRDGKSLLPTQALKVEKLEKAELVRLEKAVALGREKAETEEGLLLRESLAGIFHEEKKNNAHGTHPADNLSYEQVCKRVYGIEDEGTWESLSESIASPEAVGALSSLAGALTSGIAMYRLYNDGADDNTFQAARGLAMAFTAISSEDGQPLDPAASFMRPPIDADVIPDDALNQALMVGGNPFTGGGIAPHLLSPEQRLALAGLGGNPYPQGAQGFNMTDPSARNLAGLGYNGLLPRADSNALSYRPTDNRFSNAVRGQVFDSRRGRTFVDHLNQGISDMGQSSSEYNQRLTRSSPHNVTFGSHLRAAQLRNSEVFGWDSSLQNLNNVQTAANNAQAGQTPPASAIVDPLVAINSARSLIEVEVEQLYRKLPSLIEKYQTNKRNLSTRGGLLRGGYRPSRIARFYERRNEAILEYNNVMNRIQKLQYMYTIIPTAPDVARRIMEQGLAQREKLRRDTFSVIASLRQQAWQSFLQEFLFFKSVFADNKLLKFRTIDNQSASLSETVQQYLDRNDKEGLKKILEPYRLRSDWKRELQTWMQEIQNNKSSALQKLTAEKKNLQREIQNKPKGLYELSPSAIKWEEINLTAYAYQAKQNLYLLDLMEKEAKSKNFNPQQLKLTLENIAVYRHKIENMQKLAHSGAVSLAKMHDLQHEYRMGLEDRKVLELRAAEFLQ
ncbi:MAG: hypothetical protein HYS98_00965 [Deltaproteobacteria bacterium]|nr:hypothetical protein [Deltaproteobacteria bacterium]